MKKELSEAAQVASKIRQILKAFSIPAKVQKEHYNCVRVDLLDWYEPETLNAIKNKLYQFDEDTQDVSNTDLFIAQNKRDDVPQVRFLFINNGAPKESDEVLAREYLAEQMGITDDETARKQTWTCYNTCVSDCFKGCRLQYFVDWLESNHRLHLFSQKSHYIKSEPK